MVFLILFSAFFMVVFAIAAGANLIEMRTYRNIVNSPGLALAAPVGTNRTRTGHHIEYRYRVAGKDYDVESGQLMSMRREEVAAVTSLPPVEVMYDTTSPSRARLKSEFKWQAARASPLDALAPAALIALVIALPLAVWASWGLLRTPQKRLSWRARQAEKKKRRK